MQRTTGPLTVNRLVAASTAILLLAACGSESSDTAASPGSDTVEEIKIASASSSLSGGALLGAISLDTFADNGLKADYTDFAGSSPNTVAALTSGAADVALVGAATGWDAMQEGAPMVVVAALAGNTSELAIRTDVAERLGVTPEDDIEQRVEALRGLRIATAKAGSANFQMLRSVLSLYGVDPDKDVTIVPSEPTAIVSGLANNAFEAAFYGTGVMQKNYADGNALQLISLPRGDVPELENIVFAMAVVREETLNDDPEMVEKFVSSIRDAGTAMEERSDESRDSIKKRWFPDMAEDIYNLSYEQVSPAWILDGKLTEKQLRDSLDFQTQTTGKQYDAISYADNVAPLARP